MGIDYERLLERVKQGYRLSEHELASIREQLNTGRFEGDPYTLIHILGRAGDAGSLPIIKAYITYDVGREDEDGLIRRVALQVAGRMLNDPTIFPLAEEKAFHDPSWYVRAAAASLLGYLGTRYAHLKPHSASCILKGLEEEQDRDVLESFYIGLLELLEIDPREWPLPSARISKAQMRAELIEEAKRLANSTRT